MFLLDVSTQFVPVCISEDGYLHLKLCFLYSVDHAFAYDVLDLRCFTVTSSHSQ